MFVMFVNKESGVGSSDLRKGKTYLNWRAKSFEAIERSQPWDKTCWFHRSCPLNALELLRTHTPVILYLVLQGFLQTLFLLSSAGCASAFPPGTLRTVPARSLVNAVCI